jgi:uncharacterized protein
MRRRQWLGLLAAVGLPPKAWARGPEMLVAAWSDDDGRHRAGLLAPGVEAVDIVAEVDLPGRPHGLLQMSPQDLLIVARRPGDWLMRWWPREGRRSLHWLDDDRRLCGHALLDPAGRLLTTEMDLEHERGLVVVREAGTLRPQAEWLTQGVDPHDMLLEDAFTMLVANGGVPTRPETGRVKLEMAGMDASLVRLSLADGRLAGQWRLTDRRLSVRHLARHHSGAVGVALQAEHDATIDRAAAPVLALFDGHRLEPAHESRHLAGYAGDIVETERGYAVGATRAGRHVEFDLVGRRVRDVPQPQACAQTEVWSVGLQLLHRARGRPIPWPADRRLDNHALPWKT